MVMSEMRLFVLFFAFVNAQIGDRCILQSTNQEGICKLDCPAAVEQAKRGIPVTRCGFHALTIPILCCEIPLTSDTFAQPNDHTFVQPLDNGFNQNNQPQDNSFVHPQDNLEANDNTFLSAGDIIFPESPHSQSTSNNNQRISEQKCEEYSREVSKVVQVTPLILPSTPIKFTVAKCDYNSVPLIVGGQPASPGEFPFMAAIGFNTDEQNDRWRCGGTLISEWFVLTAAHCTDTLDLGPPTMVRLGHLILSSSGPLSQDHRIERIHNHPDYKPHLKYHDIALIKTRTKIVFTNFTRPACLYTKSTINRHTALATGWGKLGYASENSDILRKVSLDIYGNQLCQERYKNNTALPIGVSSNMICAGQIKGGRDTCQGDSGGPLLITKEGNLCQFFVIGITSFGKSCGQVNTPAIYTKVSDYVEWIESIVW